MLRLSNILKSHFSKLAGKQVYIVASKRTPIASYLGAFKDTNAPLLASHAIKACLNSLKLKGKDVDEVILGNVCSAGLGQNPTRQASLGAGIPQKVPCMTINKVCASGMKSIIFGAMGIQLGNSNVAVVGGFENMSRIPYYLTREKLKQPDARPANGLFYDGLTDAFGAGLMGICAEKTASDFSITKQDQDDFSVLSYLRAKKATEKGWFAQEISPFQGVKVDDEFKKFNDEFKKFNEGALRGMDVIFKKDGTISAGNASKINDAGCALVIASKKATKKHNWKPLARIVGYQDAEVAPIDFCIAPAKAMQQLLKKTGMKQKDISYFEINEAFAVTTLANMKILGLKSDQVNVHGGAVALGHPIGFSGGRIVQSLISVLARTNTRYGMAGICNGGGGASALIIENMMMK